MAGMKLQFPDANLTTRSPSKTAEVIAMMRANESRKPEDERICYDPYAARFISRETLESIARNPEQYRAMAARMEAGLPGHVNSLVARVRYFDDIVKSSLAGGMEQLVILGAGYDTRAYRIDGTDKIRVFEVDHPATQPVKTEKIREIFASLPGHVTYVPVDLGADDLGQRLTDRGYDPSRKTLFIMEGILMYLPPDMVDQILSFIVRHSGRGSAILFDYIPQSVVDGTCTLEIGRNMYKSVADVGEPFTFGISDGELETFLSRRGFTRIGNVTAGDYRKAYFHGKNAERKLNSLIMFACAEIGDRMP